MTRGTVLVTGAAGLLGRAVHQLLVDAGRETVAIDRLPTGDDRYPVVECDLTDVHRLHAVVRGKELAGVIHCGAFSGPMVARDNPPAMVAVNIVGTANMLEVARINQAKRFVYCSSTSAYGINRTEGASEDVALHPTTVYGASKATGEHLVSAYSQQYGLDGTSMRISWVYGPRRTTDCIIRTMIEDALAGRKTRLAYGRSFRRQFIHVDDAAGALVAAFDRTSLPRDVYTVTGDTYVTLGEVADLVRKVFPDADIDVAEGADPVDDSQARFDISAAKRDLDFLPRTNLEEGIRSYAAYLRRLAESRPS